MASQFILDGREGIMHMPLRIKRVRVITTDPFIANRLDLHAQYNIPSCVCHYLQEKTGMYGRLRQ